MANALGSLAGNLIAQRSLEILANTYPALSLVSTDFSDQNANYNQSIVTRIITPGTAGDYNTTDGFAAQDATATDVSVTLNKFKYSSFEIFPTEFNATNRNLVEDFAQKVAIEIGDAIYGDMCALFVAANYASTATTQAVSGATRANVIIAANTALSKRKVAKTPRFAIYNSDLHGELMKDTSIVNPDFKADVEGTGISNIHGVYVTENPSLITTANLIGVQGHKSAVVVATRVPNDPASMVDGLPQTALVSNVTHPDLGITMQVRAWSNPLKGSVQYTASIIYGVAKGQTNALQLIKSA